MSWGSGPLEADVKTCKCGASIVFLRTKKGNRMPVNVVPTDAKFRGPSAGELEYAHGVHQPHWATCEHAPDFKR